MLLRKHTGGWYGRSGINWTPQKEALIFPVSSKGKTMPRSRLNCLLKAIQDLVLLFRIGTGLSFPDHHLSSGIIKIHVSNFWNLLCNSLIWNIYHSNFKFDRCVRILSLFTFFYGRMPIFGRTGLCNRSGSKTLETAHPEKPTPSGFRAKNYKIRLGWNVLIPLNPKFQVDWSTTSWDIHH